MLNETNVQKWCYENLDLAEEKLERHKKTIIIIAGASSSGKSFASEKLKELLDSKNMNAVILSTDHYNKGISGIITDKVNQNFFEGKLENIDKIKEAVKSVVISTDFDKKFNNQNLKDISEKIKDLIGADVLPKFLDACKHEFDRINFDEVSVYDLKELGNDINKLYKDETVATKDYSMVISERITKPENVVEGSKIKVIIVEGIYALNDLLINAINTRNLITNFIEGDDKTLFLRRVIRDAERTSADNCFTVKNYFKYVVPSYLSTILPTKAKADIVLENDMAFDELRKGMKYSNQEKIKVSDKELLAKIMSAGKVLSTEYQRDLYFNSPNDNIDDNDNLLRLRTISSDGGKTYTLSSLVHKGQTKTRKDSKIIRPINILIKEGEFPKIYKNENELLTDFASAGLIVCKVIIKKRTRLELAGQNFVIDSVKGLGTFVEYDSKNENVELIKALKQSGKLCGSLYAESKKCNMTNDNTEDIIKQN